MASPCVIGGRVSAVTPDRPNPNLCLMASSSNPEILDLCLFIGLPTTDSRGNEGLRSYEALLSSAGGVERTEDSGGVVPLVGVLEAGDFLVAGDPAFTGSEECCRFNYEACEYAILVVDRSHKTESGVILTLIF